MNDVTRILSALEQGEPHAAEQLLPLVYDELRGLATAKIAREKPGQTLQATALVHEAYCGWSIRRGPELEQPRPLLRRRSRGHAAHPGRECPAEEGPEVGGDHRRVELSDVEPAVAGPRVDLLALDEALAQVEAEDKRKADLVKLRYFAGLTNEQAAQALGISSSTADNDWAYARGWLRLAIEGNASRDPGF
jgi:DNA-directed RNA polymerase specialized sigma24 family protein